MKKNTAATRCINYIIPVSIYLSWKCFKPTKKSWWLSSSFDWFTCRNKSICNHATFSLPTTFNKSMKNLECYLIDFSFLDPRGMIFCHSLIPRFLEEWDSPRICHPYYRQWVYKAPLCITLRIKTWVVAYLKLRIIFLRIKKI